MARNGAHECECAYRSHTAVAQGRGQGAQLRVSTNLTRTIFSLTTDDYGLATFEFTPRREPVTITARATNADGQTALVTQTLDAAPAEEGIILRANQSLAKVGDRVNVAVVSSAKSGTTYLDVIRNKQTILTKAMPAEHGQASLRLSLTEDMVGTLEIHAYKILPNEDIIRDAHERDIPVVVLTAKDLRRDERERLLGQIISLFQKATLDRQALIASVDETLGGR